MSTMHVTRDNASTYIHAQLFIAKRILDPFYCHQGRPQTVCNLGTHVQHVDDDRPKLFVTAMLVQNFIEAFVVIQLLSRRVK